MRILVVDDDETLRLSLKLGLESEGHIVDEAHDGSDAIRMVEGSRYHSVILDVNMPRVNGLEALRKIKALDPRILCIILTAHSDVKDAVTAIKFGAYDYIEKPAEIHQITDVMNSAMEANALVEAIAHSAPKVQFAEGQTMIGGSSEIKQVFGIIYKLAKVDTSVLIRGESGTGKELVARALHFNSHRKKGPFVAVNCGAIPENLIESELFGHEKGAFTSAEKRKIGKFQFAEGGTLFLDEIGDISPAMQVKLLRVLQEKNFTPIGSHQEIPTDVRIVAATNKPLEDMIEKESFRADLFYRLNVLPIHLPPLRDRCDDINSLAEFMIKKFNKEHQRQILKIEAKTLAKLKLYHWPGNIRELENVIEHAFILENSEVITEESIPQYLWNTGWGKKSAGVAKPFIGSQGQALPAGELNYPALKEQFEREFLVKALKTFNGRINQTALHTKMTKVTLLRKLEKYGIKPKEYYPQQP